MKPIHTEEMYKCPDFDHAFRVSSPSSSSSDISLYADFLARPRSGRIAVRRLLSSDSPIFMTIGLGGACICAFKVAAVDFLAVGFKSISKRSDMFALFANQCVT